MIDPITYEVIRHNLWNINEELGDDDPAHLRLAGPCMSGVSEVQVKWTLRDGLPASR